MAGLFLIHDRDPEHDRRAIENARGQFASHGFSDFIEVDLGAWTLLHAPHILGGPQSLLIDDEDVVAVAGTLTVDGRIGAPALRLLLDLAGDGPPDWSRVGGQFVALVRKAGRTYLFTDYFASFQVYHDVGMGFFSTSLLAATQALPRLSFDTQGVYEFALNVAPVGDDTIFAELKTLGPDRMVELTREGAVARTIDKPLPEGTSELSVDRLLADSRERLLSVVESYVSHFGDRVYCPLSGGLDSRLVLAALRAAGCDPNLFVYGNPESPDVEIARAIAEAEGKPIEWIDKLHWREVSPEEYPDQVAHNFQAYDATPNFGALFENGANDMARTARHRGGALSASGGCGEIYRNFFYLPDRPFKARDVACAFFARYTTNDLTSEFEEADFLRRIEDKILLALERPGDRSKLPRAVIEQIYPRVRCRALFGKEISMEGRCGAYLMPFLDHRVAAAAMTLPLGIKNAGDFEAQLLAGIDPVLAARPSAYGHDFLHRPSARHRLSEWSTRVRPIWLRQKSYGLRRKLGPVADEHGGLLTPEYMSRVVDMDFPIMRRYFHVDRIADSSIMRRVANLEYFGAQLGSKLAS